jgi:hypothetical protein
MGQKFSRGMIENLTSEILQPTILRKLNFILCIAKEDRTQNMLRRMQCARVAKLMVNKNYDLDLMLVVIRRNSGNMCEV